MNRGQFFTLFKDKMTKTEKEYFTLLWDEFEQYQTNFKEDFPFKKDTPNEVKTKFWRMWRRAIEIYNRRDKHEG